MKQLFLVLIFIFVLIRSEAQTIIPIQISDVVNRVSHNNYKVYENALKVYQAKTNIEKARRDLLPKLNLWTIAKVIIDPISIVDSITDIAPFLVPSNWFRLEEIKLLYLAEKEGYRALWGNEVNVAKSLYAHVIFDKNLLKHIQNSTQELIQIHRIILTRETFGGAKPGTARDIEIKILGLKEDEENLKNLIRTELDELSYILGYNSETILDLNDFSLPNLSIIEPIDTKNLEFKVISNSPERRQFDHFLSALVQVKKGLQYSILGGSSISRGVAGGIFDSLPESNGIGLSTSPALKIVDAQKEILITQKIGVEEILKRQLSLVANQLNSDIRSYDNYKRRYELSKESKDAFLKRIQMGENIEIQELSEISKNKIQSETALLTLSFRAFTTLDKLDRLMFEGDYSMSIPPLIESLKGKTP